MGDIIGAANARLAHLILTADVPHCQVQVLILQRFDVEANRRNCCDCFAELQLVENRRLARRVETHTHDSGFLLESLLRF